MSIGDLFFDEEIPGLWGKINAITKFVNNPCDAPWIVYAETAVAPVGNLTLALLSFGMDDVVRSYARPRSAISRGHKRHKGRRAGRFRGIPETSDLVAEWIPGAENVGRRQVSDGVRFLWIVDGLLQRAFWYWLLIDAISDSLYIWTSLINRTDYCQAEGERGAFAQRETEGTYTGITEWRFAGPLYQQWAYHGCSWDHSVVNIPEGRWEIIYASKYHGHNFLPAEMQLRLIDETLIERPQQRSAIYEIAALQTRDIIFTTQWRGPKTLSLQINNGGSQVVNDAAHAYVRKISN